MSLHGLGAPRLGETERCIPCGEVMLEAEQEQPRHTWGEVVTASLPAPSRKPDRRNFSHLAVVVHFKLFFVKAEQLYSDLNVSCTHRSVACRGLTNSLGGSWSFPVGWISLLLAAWLEPGVALLPESVQLLQQVCGPGQQRGWWGWLQGSNSGVPIWLSWKTPHLSLVFDLLPA